MVKRVSAVDRELLICLMEECAEVIHIASKTVRHGLESYNPRELAGRSNKQALNREVGDLTCLITLLQQRTILHSDVISRYHDIKLRTLSEYLHDGRIDDKGRVVPKRGR